MNQEFSETPVSIEIEFDLDRFKIDPEKSVRYTFHFKGSDELNSIEEADIKSLHSLYACSSAVTIMLKKCIDSYYHYMNKAGEEINTIVEEGKK